MVTAKSGMSLIEVMIALSIFSMAILAIMGHQYTLDNLRANSLARALQAIAVNNVVNLVDGTNYDELGRTQRPWSFSRLQSGGTTNPPMTLNDLVTVGVLSSETGYFSGGRAADASVGNLRFYLEYYRATASLDSSLAPISSQPGVMDIQQTSPAAFKTAFNALATSTRIVPDVSLGLVDATQITPGNPVMVRLAVTEVQLGGGERQVFETFLGAQTAPQ